MNGVARISKFFCIYEDEDGNCDPSCPEARDECQLELIMEGMFENGMRNGYSRSIYLMSGYANNPSAVR